MVIHFQRALAMKEEEQSYIFAKEEQSTGIRRYKFRMSHDGLQTRKKKKKELWLGLGFAFGLDLGLGWDYDYFRVRDGWHGVHVNLPRQPSEVNCSLTAEFSTDVFHF